MRLWHYKLIPSLPRQQLLGQHRECCALRGLGWGRKHSTVDYVFKHNYMMLYDYHKLVLTEMRNRGYKPITKWDLITYRGKKLGYQVGDLPNEYYNYVQHYPEHDDEYLQKCIDNLKSKGIIINLVE